MPNWEGIERAELPEPLVHELAEYLDWRASLPHVRKALGVLGMPGVPTFLESMWREDFLRAKVAELYSSRLVRDVAAQLHEYMAFRAKEEKLSYDLDPKFYIGHLDKGITRFFGVEVSADGIVRDTQQPDILLKWRKSLK